VELERAVLDQLRVEPAVGAVVDVLIKDPVQVRSDLRALRGGVDGQLAGRVALDAEPAALGRGHQSAPADREVAVAGADGDLAAARVGEPEDRSGGSEPDPVAGDLQVLTGRRVLEPPVGTGGERETSHRRFRARTDRAGGVGRQVPLLALVPEREHALRHDRLSRRRLDREVVEVGGERGAVLRGQREQARTWLSQSCQARMPALWKSSVTGARTAATTSKSPAGMSMRKRFLAVSVSW